MKKLFLVFFVLFISFSFGQSKKKGVRGEPSTVKEENIRIVKVNSGNYDGDLTINPLRPIQAVIESDENAIYNTAGIEVKPEFPGGWTKGEEFIKKNFMTPEIDGEKIKGKVYVTFVVEKDGSLSGIKILRDIGFDTGKEAIRVLKKMPKWTSGEQNGRKVRCSYSIPIQVP